MTIIATGIDLAKNIFAVHGVNVGGTVLLRQPKVARAKLGAMIAALPPGVIGMEACSGAHYWARQFQAHGHTVRLMAPKLVTPYRMTGKRGKNDANDAAAICESASRPQMRFVPVKIEDQQARLMVHRARQGFVTARTACINRIRGLLSAAADATDGHRRGHGHRNRCDGRQCAVCSLSHRTFHFARPRIQRVQFSHQYPTAKQPAIERKS